MELIIIISVFLGYVIAYWLEAKHDNVQRLQLNAALRFSRHMKPYLENKDPALEFEREMINAQGEWHKWDFWKQAFLAILWSLIACFTLNDYSLLLLAVMIGLERLLVFNILLNFIAKNEDKLHLGEGNFDKLLVKLFGNWWPLAILVLILACVSGILWIDIPIMI